MTEHSNTSHKPADIHLLLQAAKQGYEMFLALEAASLGNPPFDPIGSLVHIRYHVTGLGRDVIITFQLKDDSRLSTVTVLDNLKGGSGVKMLYFPHDQKHELMAADDMRSKHGPIAGANL